MVGTFLDKVSGFFVQQFWVAYWGPTFVSLGLAGIVVALLVGPGELLDAWAKLGGSTGNAVVAQAAVGIVALLVVTVVAYLLGALSNPLVRLYEGYWPEFLLTRKLRAHLNQAREDGLADAGAVYAFPRVDFVMPTRLGNVLAAAEDYPRRLYQLDTSLWWPRLAVLLPEVLRSQLDATVTPLLALLNLSTMCVLLTVVVAIVAGVTHQGALIVVIILAGGMVLARLCYMAAISQAINYGQWLRVAFDLYRFEVLKQMHIPLPRSLDEELTLWPMLNDLVLTFTSPTDKKLPPLIYTHVR